MKILRALRYPLACLTASFALVSTAPMADEASYAPAVKVGAVSCKSKFPASGRWDTAFLHVWNNTCWSCPRGYARTLVPDVAGPNACVTSDNFRYGRVTKHARATGWIKTDCPSGQFWHIGDGYCYSCPSGLHRTIYGINSTQACQGRVQSTNAAAVKRGNAGCPEGAFRHFLSNACYRCPDGMVRSLHIKLDGRLEELETACATALIPPSVAPGVVEIAAMNALRAEYADLIDQAAAVAWKLMDHRGEIEAAAAERRPIRAEVAQATGLTTLQANAANRGMPGLTMGASADVSVLMGAAWSGGVALGGGEARAYESHTWSVCCSLGADVAIELGMWRSTPSQMAGPGHGFNVGAAIKGGIQLTFWWSYCDADDASGCVFKDFQGLSIVPQAGLAAEAEYVRGRTMIR